MMRKLLCGALLAACGPLALADTVTPTEWEFSWQGFWVYPGGGFGYDDPAYTFTGTFAGIDADHDGVIGRGELTSLVLDGTQYVGCAGYLPSDSCGISAFSYSAEGGLVLSAQRTIYSAEPGSEAGWTAQSWEYRSGDRIARGHFGYQMPLEEYSLTFASYTTTTVTQISAVPEPATYAMLAAGLLMVGAGARRGRKAR